MQICPLLVLVSTTLPVFPKWVILNTPSFINSTLLNLQAHFPALNSLGNENSPNCGALL